MTDLDAAHRIVSASRSCQRLPRAIKADLPMYWQEIALSIDRDGQDAAIDRIGFDDAQGAEILRSALAHARREQLFTCENDNR